MQTQSDVKLSHEVDSDLRKKKLFFGALWVFLALTSAVFGYQNLGQLFSFLISVFPLSEAATAVAANSLGAASAVLLLDGGYKGWEYVRRNHTNSMAQIGWARLAEEFSFWVSVYFTTWVLFDLVLSQWLTPEIIYFAGQVGAVAFVTTAAISGIAMRFFILGDPEIAAKLQVAEFQGKTNSEQLAFAKEVQTEALRSAKTNSTEAKEALTKMLTEQWSLNILSRALGAAEDDEASRDVASRLEVVQGKQLPPPEPKADRYQVIVDGAVKEEFDNYGPAEHYSHVYSEGRSKTTHVAYKGEIIHTWESLQDVKPEMPPIQPIQPIQPTQEPDTPLPEPAPYRNGHR